MADDHACDLRWCGRTICSLYVVFNHYSLNVGSLFAIKRFEISYCIYTSEELLYIADSACSTRKE